LPARRGAPAGGRWGGWRTLLRPRLFRCCTGWGVGIGRGRSRRRLRIVSWLDRIVLNGLFHRAQPGDVFLVLVVSFGESVPAAAVGDEEQVAGTRWIGSSLKRSAAGIGDRSGRQAVDDVSIVRRRLLNFAALDRPAQRSLAADQPIDDGRIGLQLHF